MIARNERADRPLVASMSDLAASGGYYIAMPAQVIVAQPSTLTGSIGIFGGKFVTGGVYEKLGAHIESTSIGTHAEINSPARPYNPEELKKLQEQLQAFYDQFVEKVAESRHTTAGEDRRARAGARLDRPAGEAERPGRRARRPRSRDRGRQAARQDSGRQRRGAGRLSAAQELLRAGVGAVVRQSRADGVSAWSRRQPGPRGAGGAADARCAARDVPPRRAAGADAVHVLPVKRAEGQGLRCGWPVPDAQHHQPRHTAVSH